MIPSLQRGFQDFYTEVTLTTTNQTLISVASGKALRLYAWHFYVSSNADMNLDFNGTTFFKTNSGAVRADLINIFPMYIQGGDGEDLESAIDSGSIDSNFTFFYSIIDL